MVDEDLGRATLAYEGPDGETVERTVDNEHVAYFQDHWIVKVDDGDGERDTVRRIPAGRVFYVERDVEAFEEEVATLLDDVQSVGEELRSRVGAVADGLPTDVLRGSQSREPPADGDDVLHIDVETGETVDDAQEQAGED